MIIFTCDLSVDNKNQNHNQLQLNSIITHLIKLEAIENAMENNISVSHAIEHNISVLAKGLARTRRYVQCTFKFICIVYSQALMNVSYAHTT